MTPDGLPRYTDHVGTYLGMHGGTQYASTLQQRVDHDTTKALIIFRWFSIHVWASYRPTYKTASRPAEKGCSPQQGYPPGHDTIPVLYAVEAVPAGGLEG